MTIGQLAAIRARIAGRLEPHTDVTEIAMAVADLRSLLDEVDRLHIERDAGYRRGAEAMRAVAVEVARKRADLPVISDTDAAWCRSAQCIVDELREIAVPEDKS
jgi:hypothetical protein